MKNNIIVTVRPRELAYYAIQVRMRTEGVLPLNWRDTLERLINIYQYRSLFWAAQQQSG